MMSHLEAKVSLFVVSYFFIDYALYHEGYYFVTLVQ